MSGFLYLIEAGLTRRLVEADDEISALNKFLNDSPIRRHYAGFDETHVRRATDVEVAEFAKRRGARPGAGRLALTLDDARKEKATRNRGARGKKEHA